MDTRIHDDSRSWLLALVSALALTAALIVAVGAAHGAARPAVKTHSSPLGKILVDGQGRTLYLFEKDRRGRSACDGLCATYWPPLLVKGKPAAGIGAKASLLGTTRRANGALQVTYAHHPLYRYAGDAKPGQTNGEGLDDFGAMWDVVAPSGKGIDKD